MTKLTDYIEKELKKGFSQQQIKAVFLKYKYDEQAVDEAFTQVSHHEFPQHKLEVPHIGKMMFGIIMTIVIAMAVLFSVRYVQKTYFDEDAFLKEYHEQQAKQAAAILKTTTCKEIEDVEQQDICLLKLSAEKNTVEYCDAIESFYILVDCKAKIWEKDECRYFEVVGEDSFDCYTRMAIENKDFSICAKSSDYERCKTQFFTEYKEVRICKDDFVCIIALVQATKDLSKCTESMLSEQDKNLCLNSLKTDNPNKK